MHRLLLSVVLVGCQAGQMASNTDVSNTPEARLAQRERAAEADGKALRAVAERFWAARVSEDWKVVYEHLPAKVRGEEGWEAWAEWAAAESPFIFEQADPGEVEAMDGFGWQSVAVRTRIRRFPQLEARELNRNDCWKKEDGRWVIVEDRKEKEKMPAKPSTRDLLAEELVRDVHAIVNAAREARNFDRYWDHSDPDDREVVARERFDELHAEFGFFGATPLWIEVVGDSARVQHEILIKNLHPSLRKMDPQPAVLVEEYRKVDGNWYYDFKTDHPGAPSDDAVAASEQPS